MTAIVCIAPEGLDIAADPKLAALRAACGEAEWIGQAAPRAASESELAAAARQALERDPDAVVVCAGPDQDWGALPLSMLRQGGARTLCLPLAQDSQARAQRWRLLLHGDQLALPPGLMDYLFHASESERIFGENRAVMLFDPALAHEPAPLGGETGVFFSGADGRNLARRIRERIGQGGGAALHDLRRMDRAGVLDAVARSARCVFADADGQAAREALLFALCGGRPCVAPDEYELSLWDVDPAALALAPDEEGLSALAKEAPGPDAAGLARAWAASLGVAARYESLGRYLAEGLRPAPGAWEARFAARVEHIRTQTVLSTEHMQNVIENADLAPPSAGRVFCEKPWSTLQLYFDNGFGPCCDAKNPCAAAIPSSREELMRRWNAPELVDLRRRMVAGDIAGTPCETCASRPAEPVRHIPRLALDKDAGFERRFEAADKAYARGDTVLDQPPLNLTLFTSVGCNLRCIMCCQNKNALPFPESRVLTLFDECPPDSFNQLSLVGGEVFFTKDARAILDRVLDLGTGGSQLALTTNGVLLGRYIDRLAGVDNLFMNISIDGAGEVYESIRRGSSWQLILANMTRLGELAESRPHWDLRVASLVLRRSMATMLELANTFQPLGFCVRYKPFRYTLHDTENFYVSPHLLDDPQGFDALVDEVRRVSGEHGDDIAVNSLGRLRRYLASAWNKRFELLFRVVGISLVEPDGAARSPGAIVADLRRVGVDEKALVEEMLHGMFTRMLDEERPVAPDHFMELAELFPANVRVLTTAGRGLRLAGQADRAEAVLRDALGRMLVPVGALCEISRIMVDQGRMKEALEFIARAESAELRNPVMRERFARLRNEAEAGAAI